MSRHKFTFMLVVSIASIGAVAGITHPAKAQDTAEGISVSPSVKVAERGPVTDNLRISGLGFRELVPDAQIATIDGVVSANFSLDYNFAAAPKTISTKSGKVIFGSFSTVSVKASVPLNSASADTAVDFKNFGNKGKLTINYNYFAPKFASPTGLAPFNFRFGETCLVEQGKMWASEAQTENGKVLAPEERSARVSAVLTSYRMQMSGSGLWDEAITVAKSAEGAGGFGPVAFQECFAGNGHPMNSDTDLARRYAGQTFNKPEEYNSFYNSYIRPGRTNFLGGSVSFGYNRFSIVDRPTFTVDNAGRVGFDFNLRAGTILAGSGTLLALGGGFVRTYEPKDEIEVCSAQGPTSRCVKGQDGFPDRRDTGYVEVSWRQVVLRDKNGNPLLGISPKVSYDFKANAVQVNFPIFFQHSKESGLDAGIEGIWNSDKKGVAVGAFIGVPFGGF